MTPEERMLALHDMLARAGWVEITRLDASDPLNLQGQLTWTPEGRERLARLGTALQGLPAISEPTLPLWELLDALARLSATTPPETPDRRTTPD
jgi:hypothetical protein